MKYGDRISLCLGCQNPDNPAGPMPDVLLAMISQINNADFRPDQPKIESITKYSRIPIENISYNLWS